MVLSRLVLPTLTVFGAAVLVGMKEDAAALDELLEAEDAIPVGSEAHRDAGTSMGSSQSTRPIQRSRCSAYH